MPIIHNYSDKQIRKLKFTVLIYVAIALVSILVVTYVLSGYFRRPDSQNLIVVQKDKLCIEADVAADIQEKLTEYIKDKDIEIADSNCTITIARNPLNLDEYTKIYSKTYVFVTRYDSLITNISETDIANILNNQTISGTPVIWDQTTDQFVRSRFDVGVGQVTIDTQTLQNRLKENSKLVALVPFDQLKAMYKVIGIDDNNPLLTTFNPQRYILVDSYWIKGDKEKINSITEYLQKNIDITNYNPKLITSLLLTGSSAYGAGEQKAIIERNKDPLFMLRPIASEISQADIAQINNETSYIYNCPQGKTSRKFCGEFKNIESLKTIGFDVIGVNGNHILDFGEKPFINTLNKYTQSGLQYYGGGKNALESYTPASFNSNNNNISFIGFNFMYPFSYYAKTSKPGSANIDENILANRLRDIPHETITIVDMGWGYEDKSSLVDYQKSFASIALSNSADIVIGTNSTVMQKLEITDKNIVAYNIGSFLAPNMDKLRKYGSYMLKVYIYNKKIVSTEVIPIVLNSKNQIQLADQTQKATILKALDNLSN